MVREKRLGDLSRLICTGGNPAIRAEGPADLGVQQSQEISNFRCRPDGRAGVANVIFLLDGDGRSDVLQPIDVWAIEFFKKHAGIGGEGLDVAPLPFGEDRVEGQGGFSGA